MEKNEYRTVSVVLTAADIAELLADVDSTKYGWLRDADAVRLSPDLHEVVLHADLQTMEVGRQPHLIPTTMTFTDLLYGGSS